MNLTGRAEGGSRLDSESIGLLAQSADVAVLVVGGLGAVASRVDRAVSPFHLRDLDLVVLGNAGGVAACRSYPLRGNQFGKNAERRYRRLPRK